MRPVRRKTSSFFRSIAVAMGIVLPSAPAFGWVRREHHWLGKTAYQAACQQLGEELARDAATADVAARFAVACGSHLVRDERSERFRNHAEVYGQSVAIAGDHLDDPEQFFSAVGGRRAISEWNYLGLALANSSHFRPEAPRRWRKYHTESVRLAIAAAAEVAGVAQIAAFEHAFYLHAFSDHFLGDSFAAGHMGFNRPASSASASYVFHNEGNKKGRILRNDRGEIWIGYGDHRLHTTPNARNKALAVQAATSSVRAFLHAFLFARVDTHDELEVEATLPSSMYAVASPGYAIPPLRRLFAPETVGLERFRAAIEAAPSDAARRALGTTPWTATTLSAPATNDDVMLAPVRTLQDRAFKDVGFDLRWIYGGKDRLGQVQALMASASARFVTHSVRFQLSAGFFYEPTVVSLWGPAVSWQFASTFRGFVTHDILVASWLAGCLACLEGVAVLPTYRINFELGRQILGLYVSPSPVFDSDGWTFAWFTGLSLEWLVAASGGGPI